ncbi:orphan sodium- and chloride-dependent neurotransmitter transporter NTT5-like isoform X2 [Erinaceus europaeus]|uniref:Transporter n=1 Tax=Erinaceus europaeus TaxID=9365 RepID=A0ABM3W0P5_ERIEU|nr:orphan sodium- and chloride-dependent neurotransmitter transporter NTT5-like isoform X2 [Erinaceus europaeus]
MESLEEISKDSAHGPPSKPPASSLTVKEIVAARHLRHCPQTKRTVDILTHTVFTVGMGCIWRFPYLCHRNGGGNYILMYFFMLLLLGVPLLYMEMVLGHWLRVDHLHIWKQLVPWMGGIGYASMMVCFLVTLYNSIVVTWTFSYLISSFSSPVPWGYCPLETVNASGISCLQAGPHQYFWYHTTLQASGQIEEGGHFLVLNLTAGIFTIWLLLFLFMVFGLRVSLPVLAGFLVLPYFFLLCFLVRSFLLDGVAPSLQRMLKVELSAWTSLDLWRQAASHTLYSLGLGLGLVNLPSYKVLGGNYLQVALLVAVTNLATSLLATCIVFTIQGFWVNNSGHICVEKGISKLLRLIEKGVLSPAAKPPSNMELQPVSNYLDWIQSLPEFLSSQVVHSSPSCSIRAQDKVMEGPGLALVAYSQVISFFPGSFFWAIIFFLFLLALGLNTLLRMVEGITSPLQSTVPMFQQYPKLPLVVVCLAGFLGSLVFTSRSGSYIMSMFDDHLVPLMLAAIMTIQTVTLAWIHGAWRFRDQLFIWQGHLLWSFLTVLWCGISTPGTLALLVLCLLQLCRWPPGSYTAWNSTAGQEVQQPHQRSSLTWTILLSVLALLPILAHPLSHCDFFSWVLSPKSHLGSHLTRQNRPAPKPVNWPKRKLVSPRLGNPSEVPKFSLPYSRTMDLTSPWNVSMPSSKTTNTYSWVSLPPTFNRFQIFKRNTSVSPWSESSSRMGPLT